MTHRHSSYGRTVGIMHWDGHWMQIDRCYGCRQFVSLGPAPAALPIEWWLGEVIRDISLLWEPGAERERRIAEAVEVHR